MKRTIITVIIIVLFLAACGALKPGAPGVEEAELPEATATAPPAAGLGVVKLDEKEGRLRGGQVDPATLADLPGYSALDFGHHYTYALSPDGRTMAMIAWPAGSHSQGGALQLVDLPSWEAMDTGVTINGHVSSLRFGLDGGALYWVEPERRATADPVPHTYRLNRHDLEGAGGAEGITVATLPPSFMPQEMRLLPAGGRLAIYGVPTGADYLAEGPPRVLLVDLPSGEVAVDVALAGVTAGQFRVETGEGNPYSMVQPALAWDTARNLLYVVHGDEDRVTVVDLAEGVVRRQVKIRRRASLLARIVGWGARTAEAKVVPSADKRAALSADGRWLYVTGLRREMRPDWNEQGWPYDETPLGLQVIDAKTLAEVARLDLPATDLALSPNGRRLLTIGAYNVPNADNGSERVAHGLYLLDAASLDVVAHLLPEQEVTLQGFSPGGRHAYISTSTSEWLDGRGHTNWRTTLYLLDLQTGTPAAEREFPGSFLDIMAGE